MTSNVKEQIAQMQELTEALQFVVDNPKLQGALKVSGDGLKGAIAFSSGRVVGAFIDKTGQTGEEALNKLMQIAKASIKYAKFDQKQIVAKERVDVDIAEYLKNIVEKQKAAAETAAPAAEEEVFAATETAPAAEEIAAATPCVADVKEPEAKAAEAPPKHDEEETGEQPILKLDEPAAAVEPTDAVEQKIEASIEQAAEDNPHQDQDSETVDIRQYAKELLEEMRKESEGKPSDELADMLAAKIEEPAATESTAESSEAPADEAAAETGMFPTYSLVEGPQTYDPNETVEIGVGTGIKREPKNYDAMIKQGRFEDVMKDLSESDDTEEFKRIEIGHLLSEESGLNDAQRALLKQLGENMRDEEAFNEQDPELAALDDEPDLTEHQIELLATAPLDEQSFDHTEVHINHDIPSLNPQQQAALDLVRETHSDIATFEELNDFLQEKGLKLTSQQLWELGEVMFARSREEMEEEFARLDEKLRLDGPTEFKEFVEPVAPVPVAEDLDAIPAPKVIDADYSPLIADAPAAEHDQKPERKEGIINRWREGLLGHVPGFYSGPRRKRKKKSDFPLGKVMAVVTLASLGMGILYVPPFLRSLTNDKSAEALAAAQMQSVIGDDIREELATASKDEVRGPAGGTGGGGGGGGVDYESALENDTLAFARALAAKGNLEAAVQYYEKYIGANPKTVAARIELIHAFMLMKKYSKARALCMATLQLGLTPSEIAGVWALLRQCMANNSD